MARFVIQVMSGCRSQDALSTHWAVRDTDTGELHPVNLTKAEAQRKAKSLNRLYTGLEEDESDKPKISI